jgi:hypothetical protein
MRRTLALMVTLACGTDVPGPPAALVHADVAVSGEVATTISLGIRALDAQDRPIPGLALDAVALQGVLAEGRSSTDQEGVARFHWTLGTVAGSQALDVSVVGGGPSERFSIPVRPGPAAVGHFLEPSVVATGGRVVTLPVAAYDAYGNAHPDPPLTGTPGQAVADSGRWTATILGRIRFTLDLPGQDSLDVYVQTPPGPYRVQFLVADTLFVETGVFAPSEAEAATICTVPANAHTVHVLDAITVRRIRRTTDGFEDTLDVPLRVGALVHAMEPDVSTAETQVVRFQPEGRPAPATCSGTVFVRAWKFALFGALQDSLVITPN